MQHSSSMTALPYLPRCAALHQRPFATWFSHVNIGYASQLILGVWLICTIRPPHDFRSLLQPGSGVAKRHGFGRWQSAQTVRCMLAMQRGPSLHAASYCQQYRTKVPWLRRQHSSVDRVYAPLLSDVANLLDEIDSAPPSFISAYYRPAV